MSEDPSTSPSHLKATLIAPGAQQQVPAADRSVDGRSRRWPTRVWRLLGLAVLLALLIWLVPYLVERIRYAAVRGEQRAEIELAAERFGQFPLQELSRASERLSRAVGPVVVHVDARRDPTQDLPPDEFWQLFGEAEQEPTPGQGSGVIVDSQGHILTNYHVIRGADRIHVVMNQDRRLPAQVVGADALTDLAVLKIEAQDLEVAQWGDSDELQAGALVWAVGSPFGLDQTITFGILSAKNRRYLQGNPYQEFLQTDAAVNPGNSGGPLVDMEGRVVGINTAILGHAYQGISFAIPSKIAREVYEQLKAHGRVARGWLGVALDQVPPEKARELGLQAPEGAWVVALTPSNGENPAHQAGVRVGDVIVRWNQQPIDTPSRLSRLIAQTPIGSQATLVVIRDAQRQELQVVVGQRPEQMTSLPGRR